MFFKKLFSLSSEIKKIIPASVKHNLKKYKHKVFGLFFDVLEPIIGKFVTFHTRPMFAAGVYIDPKDVDQDHSEFAVILQGPVNKRNNFTLETLLLYNKYFRNALIILSTWEGEDEYCIEQARKAGAEVILNKEPEFAGNLRQLGRHRNINLQIISAMAGIRRAAEVNKKYVLKMRTDERIYNHNSLIFLSNLLKDFPITVPNCRQKGRLISINNTTRKLYYFPDPMVFGYTEDLALYYGADPVPFTKDPVITIGNMQMPFAAEHYLITEFLKKIGYKFKGTQEDSYRVLARHCMMVDAASLDWYWYKYDRFFEYKLLISRYRQKYYILGFAEWLNLYNIYGKPEEKNL